MAYYRNAYGRLIHVRRAHQHIGTCDSATHAAHKAASYQPIQIELQGLLAQKLVYFRDTNFCTSIAFAPRASASQLDWCQKKVDATKQYWAARAVSPTSPPAVAAASVQIAPEFRIDFTKVKLMFDHARQHLKFPKVTLQLANGKGLVKFGFSRKRADAHEIMFMNSGDYGMAYGYINLVRGVVSLRARGEAVKTELLALLNEFAQAPKKTAMLHGRLTGNCCFCALPLSDARSLKVGWGPICAKHYGLPWENVTDAEALSYWMGLDQ